MDGIIVYSLSRLGRKMKDVVYIMDLLNKNNIEFIGYKDHVIFEQDEVVKSESCRYQLSCFSRTRCCKLLVYI